jgi:hypothetical protein
VAARAIDALGSLEVRAVESHRADVRRVRQLRAWARPRRLARPPHRSVRGTLRRRATRRDEDAHGAGHTGNGEHREQPYRLPSEHVSAPPGNRVPCFAARRAEQATVHRSDQPLAREPAILVQFARLAWRSLARSAHMPHSPAR